ncbi:MAG: YdcF family protein [Erysipelotrichaceae bacterium]|nr:YdcF family protein [Erysipelotrichaceae bacterium]
MIHKIIKYFVSFFLLIGLLILFINLLIVITTRKKIISEVDATKLDNIDCILILGAGIKNHYPSPMLEDRLLQGISLYEQQVSPKILVSGDHINKEYDEVNVMKDYLVGHKIPSQDVFMDHAGISTYDSIYRAKYIFQAKKIIIVTQKYHLYRALYIANSLGIDAYGIPSNQRTYTNQEKREVREIIARCKDFFKSMLKSPSTYLGDTISLVGNGDFTND